MMMKPNLFFCSGIILPGGSLSLSEISEESFLFRSDLEVRILKFGSSLTDLLIQYGSQISYFDEHLMYLTNAPNISTTFLRNKILVKVLYCQGYVYFLKSDDRTQPSTQKLLMCVNLNTEDLANKLKEDYIPQVDKLITYLTGIQLVQQRDEKLEMLLSEKN